MRYLSSQTFWPEVKPYLQITQIIQTWMNDLMSRLKVDSDLSINLADLFPNATLLHDYLQAAFNLDELTVAKLVSGVSVKPNKVITLVVPDVLVQHTSRTSSVFNRSCKSLNKVL